MTAADGTRRRTTILVIEDEEELRNLVEIYLGGSGFRVLTASNGLQGVEIFRRYEDTIDLVVSDLELPGMDGYNVLLAMKRIKPDVKAVFASGSLDIQIMLKLRQQGVVYFVQKPYSRTEILRAVYASLTNEAT